MVMAAEAIHLYIKLVVVLGRTIHHYVIKATVTCWSKYKILLIFHCTMFFSYCSCFVFTALPLLMVVFCFAPNPSLYMHPKM